MEIAEKIIQNIKVVTIMKSCNYTDKEIADYLGIQTRLFLDAIAADSYLSEVYSKAQEKLASDIEKKFLENTLAQLDNGDNTDAKWILERTNKKYQKKDQLDVSVTSIDDIIRNQGK
jgi:DNA-directed RNA polymerase specialized sigma subunit